MEKSILQEKNKPDMLNVLRFIAFIIIFLLHAKAFIPVAWNENYSMAWLFYTPAWAGTWIFFMLSGYGIGAGFYSGKYDTSINGIVRYYIRRIMAILPMYWFWIILIAIFIKSEILIPSWEHTEYLLQLFFFHYQEEFYSAEFGLGWYITTLVRLYFAAPFGYFLLKKTVKTKGQIYIAIAAMILTGFTVRCMMGYHIQVTGAGNWSSDIYKPFYFNLDIFFTGMLLNMLKQYPEKLSQVSLEIRKIFTLALLLGLSTINSYLYYACAYNGSDKLWIYCYLFPSAYILTVALYIYYFEIRRDYKFAKLSFLHLTENPWRLFDYFPRIQFPMYLFHSGILYCLALNYNDTLYSMICRALCVPSDYINFAKGCIYTAIAFFLSLFWAVLISGMFKKETQGRLCTYLEKKDYSQWCNGFWKKLKRIFPL
ncbi:MAG: acyltransferase family protein [Lachnospiraceae bacterium]